MVEAVIRALIAILIFALCVFLILWVLETVGIILPAMVIKILWAIAVLICILIVYRLLKPVAGGWLP